MKTKLVVLLCGLIFAGISLETRCQDLGKFESSIEKKVGPKTVKVPYTDVISYLGYAEPGSEDEIKDGKKFYYIYVWIPAVAPELGVRMMSPADATKLENPIKSAAYEANAASKDYFDTYITLEKSDITSKEGLTAESAAAATWTVLALNDDSGEMPANPGGSKYNSLLRYVSETSNPLKALVVGLYRVGFTTYKVGEVKGTFLAEVAAPVKLPGVAMAKTIDELNAALAE
jgi:hypothetical protein